MPLFLRLTLPLLLVLGAIGYALSPAVEHLVGRWFQHDVELRSQLIFNTMRDSLTTLARSDTHQDIETLFRRISEDERVLAMGLCSAEGKLVALSSAWPALIGCPAATDQTPKAAANQPLFQVKRLSGGAVLLSAIPRMSGPSGASDWEQRRRTWCSYSWDGCRSTPRPIRFPCMWRWRKPRAVPPAGGFIWCRPASLPIPSSKRPSGRGPATCARRSM